MTDTARSYMTLGWVYDQHYGYNKYTIDAYLNGLKYYSVASDSLSYYNAHITIGDYYTRDVFMQSYAEKYLKQALVFFERNHNKPKLTPWRRP